MINENKFRITYNAVAPGVFSETTLIPFERVVES
jgi:hypothetical protein